MWNQGALQLSVDCMAVPVTDTSLLVFWPVLNFKTLGHNGIELTNFPLVILAIQLKIDILTICTGGPRLVRILGPGKNRTSEIRTSRY